MLRVDGLVDSKLALVFHNLQYTTILFNKHYYNQTPINGALFQECLGFVHSGLIKLQGRLKNKLSECLCLGMMAFLATTFRLPDLYEQPYCKTLTNKLRLAYTAAKDSVPDMHTSIDTWLMFVCLISTNRKEGPDVRAIWEIGAARGLPWDEIRRQLKEVMWIDAFHDGLGKRAFER